MTQRAVSDKERIVAQDLFYQAMDAESEKEHLALLQKALEHDPECIDALLLNLQYERTNWGEYIKGLESILSIAERRLGKRFLTQNEGMFWGLVETRPYMRVRAELVMALISCDHFDDAITHAVGMLKLNPNDNQGIRYTLVGLLLRTGNPAGAVHLIEQYDEESSHWLWAKALVAFLNGGSDAAAIPLAKAREANPHALPYLAGRKRLPQRPVEFYSQGDESEAQVLSASLAPAWRRFARAKEWLKSFLDDKGRG